MPRGMTQDRRDQQRLLLHQPLHRVVPSSRCAGFPAVGLAG
jgi:hypothetical protein